MKGSNKTKARIFWIFYVVLHLEDHNKPSSIWVEDTLQMWGWLCYHLILRCFFIYYARVRIYSVLAYLCMYHYFHIEDSHKYFPSPTHSNKTSSEYKSERLLQSIAVSPLRLIIMIDQSKTVIFRALFSPSTTQGILSAKKALSHCLTCSNIRYKSFFYYWWNGLNPFFFSFRNAPHGPPKGMCKARYSLALTTSGY
jgi:hypothetical protein